MGEEEEGGREGGKDDGGERGRVDGGDALVDHAQE